MDTPSRVDSVINRRKNEIRTRLEKSTYGELAKEWGLNKGVIWKFVNTDYVPTSKEILRKLGLPEPTLVFQKRNEKGQYESF